MKKTLNIYQVDAFSDIPLGGNPAAVIPLESWLDDALLQKIANENNLSETVYFIHNQAHKFEIRWFTPEVEVDLCGHATLACAYVIFEILKYKEATIEFDSKSGILSVSKEDDLIVMDFPTDKLEKLEEIPEAFIEGFGVPILEFYKGKTDYLAIIKDETQLRNLTPNFSLIKTVSCRGVIVSAKGDEVDFVSRCFFPQSGIDEDPVTGSAHCTLVPYWSKTLGKKDFQALQLSERIGVLNCIHKEERTILKGNCSLYMIGTIFI